MGQHLGVAFPAVYPDRLGDFTLQPPTQPDTACPERQRAVDFDPCPWSPWRDTSPGRVAIPSGVHCSGPGVRLDSRVSSRPDSPQVRRPLHRGRRRDLGLVRSALFDRLLDRNDRMATALLATRAAGRSRGPVAADSRLARYARLRRAMYAHQPGLGRDPGARRGGAGLLAHRAP